MQTVLVAGGAGFIGANLCRRLLAEGSKVICLDNLSSGIRRNIRDLEDDPSFEFIHHDICDFIELKADQIYNLACPASPLHYQSIPLETTKACTVGVFQLLDLAKRNGARILQASTSEIYGDPEVHPQSESYWGHVNPVGTRSCYDEGKRCAETIFFDHQRRYGTDIRVVRIFNTYGPYMRRDDGRVISNFIVNALAGRPIRINGSGEQTRSFCYVEDLVEGLWRFMNSFETHLGPVNMGNPEEVRITDLARIILKLIGSEAQIAYKDLPEDDPRRRQPDIRIAREQLEWHPSVSLENGLLKTIDYFKTEEI